MSRCLFFFCRWVATSVPLVRITTPFYVELRFIQGAGDKGYIALDNINLAYCNPGQKTSENPVHHIEIISSLWILEQMDVQAKRIFF